MSTNELVSVVIPTYNRSAICKVAVESVLSQTYGNLEVIVVDDGSGDDTREVMEGIPDGRVRYHRQENAGVSAARNTGMALARGEYIGLLDSDDAWLPWKLDAQIQVLRSFPTAGMVWTDMAAVDEYGNTLFESYLKIMYEAYEYFDREENFRIRRPLGEVWKNGGETFEGRNCYAGNIFPWMFLGNLVHTSTVLLRRERQERVGGFDVSLLRSGEDYDFHLRTCKEGDVAYIDVSSITYRVGAADQLTADSYRVWMARNNLKTILSIHEKTGGEIGLPESEIRDRFARAHAWVGMTELFENRKTARGHLLESRRFGGKDKKVVLYYLLSFLPADAICLIRDAKRRWDRNSRADRKGHS